MAKSPPRFSSLFTQVVRRHRLARHLSQESLSEGADVDRTYVGLLERDQRSPGLDVAKRLADALGRSLAELIAETEKEWRKSQETDIDVPRPLVADERKDWLTRKKLIPARLKTPRSRSRN